MKHITVVQHTQSEWLGNIEDHLEGRGIRFSYVRPFTAGSRLPDVALVGDGLLLLPGGPWGTATPNALLPSLDAEIRLARACLMLGKPVVGFGLGAQIVSLAGDGKAEPAPLRFTIQQARATSTEALQSLLPREYPNVVYMRDCPDPPAYANVLSRDCEGRAALFQLGSNAFGFTGHPGIRRAMIEDLIMESDESPPAPAAALQRMGQLTTAIEDALVPIMTGLVAACGWMREA